jgi:putative membrane protein
MNYKTAIKSTILILGVIIIPLLYSFFYLQAFWDPYNTLKDVPVAVVNNDAGATVNGKSRNLGKEAADKLKKDDTLKFIVTNEADAQSGIGGNKYYAVITFPKDFSSKVATASTEDKKTATIEFMANKKRNYIASQIMKNVESELEEEVRGNVDKEVTVELVSKLKDVPKQLKTLNSGLDKLHSGAKTLASGSAKLENAQNTLTNGITTLGTGIDKLSSGANTLNSAIKKLSGAAGQISGGASTLGTSVTKLDVAAGKLSAGANTLSTSISKLDSAIGQISDGGKQLSGAVTKSVPQLTAGVSSLNTGAQSLLKQFSASTDTSNPTIYDGVNTLNSGTQTYVSLVDNTLYTMITTNPGSAQLLTGYKQSLQKAEVAYATATDPVTKAKYYEQVEMLANLVTIYTCATNPAVTSESAFEQALISAAKTDATQASVVSGGASLTSGAGQLLTQFKDGGAFKTGVSQLAAGTQTLANSAGSLSQLSSSVETLSNSLVALKDGSSKLSAGSKTLATSLAAFKSGSGKLATGTQSLSSYLTALSSGSGKLAAGSDALASGLSSAKSGAAALASGSGKIADADTKIANGANKLTNGINTAKNSVGKSITTTNNQLKSTDGLGNYVNNPVKVVEKKYNYIDNYGTAFAPYFMSLSLWVGAILIFFGIYLDADERIKVLSRHCKNKLLRIAAFAGIGVAQAIALGLIVQFALGFNVDNVPVYYASLVLISLTFISIVEFLITNFKDLGKFLSIAFLVLQLTACGGTFPMETVPKFFSVLYPFMPMTYTVNLIKELSVNFNASKALHNALVLVAIFIVFTLLQVLFSVTRRAKVKVQAYIQAQN